MKGNGDRVRYRKPKFFAPRGVPPGTRARKRISLLEQVNLVARAHLAPDRQRDLLPRFPVS
jgi:hypothetical protein